MESHSVLHLILNELNYGLVLLTVSVAFSLLYFTICGGMYLLFKQTNKRGMTESIRTEPRFDGQIGFEIRNSLMSIFIFGGYGLLLIFCYRNGWVGLKLETSLWLFPELLFFALWNEIHFYACHYLMHRKKLLPFHRVHHKSIVVSPFATYSFHPLESTLLGSVMIIPALVYDFQVWTLIIFPAYSLFFNALGHSNVRLKKNSIWRQVMISQQHNDHHTKFNLNFGFVSELMDRIFRTHQKSSANPKTNVK